MGDPASSVVKAFWGVCVALCLVVGRAGRADAHPLHTTMTDITLDPSGRSLHIVVRTFADDYVKAITSGRPGAATVNGPESWAYVQRAFGVVDSGRPVPLQSCGMKQSGNLLWICLEARVSGSLSAVQVRSAVLCELYDDQVNIVRARVGPAARSILFTKGDGPKALVS